MFKCTYLKCLFKTCLFAQVCKQILHVTRNLLVWTLVICILKLRTVPSWLPQILHLHFSRFVKLRGPCVLFSWTWRDRGRANFAGHFEQANFFSDKWYTFSWWAILSSELNLMLQNEQENFLAGLCSFLICFDRSSAEMDWYPQLPQSRLTLELSAAVLVEFELGIKLVSLLWRFFMCCLKKKALAALHPQIVHLNSWRTSPLPYPLEYPSVWGTTSAAAVGLSWRSLR